MNDRLDHLLQLLKESGDDSFLLFAVAKEYEKRGDFQNALENYLRILANDPAYIGLYYHLGKLYEELGQPGKAIETYRAGIQQATKSGDQHARSELASALMELED
ncbi:MAG: tetratricopeptide repeat protein [Saprospirales bacterium]|nr:tetratricopeptide repeat protein [Saprospirales bacterium]